MKSRILVWMVAVWCGLGAAALQGERLTPELEEQLGRISPGEKVRVIVEMARQTSAREFMAGLAGGTGRREGARALVSTLRRTADQQQGPIRARLRQLAADGSVGGWKPFWVFNGLAVEADASAIIELAGRPDVREVRVDRWIPVPHAAPAGEVVASSAGEWNIDAIRAPEVWSLDPAYDGTGAVVGSFDTGVDWTHPDLSSRYRGDHQTSWFDPYREHRRPYDPHGHGTMVGGDAGGTHIGVAPGALWIAAKGWSDDGTAPASTFHEIFEWFLAPDGDPDAAPDVVNNSWAFGEPGCLVEFVPDIEAWRAAGIFPAFAAGNSGPEPGSVESPGAYPGAFTVGATDPFEGIAYFSGQGPSPCDGILKPDVAAPGDGILSSVPGGYSVLSGTSMATPHVAGAVAVLRSINPELTVDQLEELLILGARDLGPAGPDNAFGNGQIDLRVSAEIALRGTNFPVVRVLATEPVASEAGPTNGLLTISRSGETSADLTVHLQIGGTALAEIDYAVLPATVVIPSGASSVTLVVEVLDDTKAELDETVEVTLLEDPDYIVSGTSRAVVTVVSDELLSDLVVAAMTAPGTAEAGTEILIEETVRNQGAGSSEPCELRIYLSADLTLDAADLALASRAVPALGPGATDSDATAVVLPADLPTATYYLLALVDAADVVVEGSEVNNGYGRTILVGPDLTLTALTLPAIAGAGQPLSIGDTTRNQGGGGSGASVTRFYLSTNTLVEPGDIVLGERAVPALQASGTDSGTTTVVVPAEVEVGTWYVIARCDDGEGVPETRENNNTLVRSIQIGPDLVTILTAPAVAGPGETITLNDLTRNQGGGSAGASVTRYYFSSNPSFDAADTPLGSRAVAALAGAGDSTGTTQVTVPAGVTSGTWYVVARCDADGEVVETSENNNVHARPILVGADLVIAALSSPAAAGAGSTIQIADTTKNQGGGVAGPSVTEFFLSRDFVIDTTDVRVGDRAVPGLASGESSASSTTVTLPADLPSGLWYVIARCDGTGVVTETAEGNNTSARSLQVGSDLVVSILTVPTTGAAGQPITIEETTRNQGGGTAAASITEYSLSLDAAWDASDVVLGTRAVESLATGASSSGVTSVLLPSGTATGSYYLLARCDAAGVVSETAENNNVLARAIQVGPDLVFTAVTAPATAGAGQSLSVTDTTRNQGAGGAPASTTRFYLSDNTIWDAADVLLGSRAVGALGGGTSDSGTTLLALPGDLATGTYHVIAVCDATAAVEETVEGNNTYARSVAVGADLIVETLTGPANAAPGQFVSLGDTTRNQGGGGAGGSTTQFFLSRDTVVDVADISLGARSVAALAAGAAQPGTVSVQIPPGTVAGTWFFLARCDGTGVVEETAENNNVYGRSVLVGGDLTVSAFTVPVAAAAGQAVSLSDTTRNAGGAAVGASVTAFYLSGDALLDGADLPLGQRSVPGLAAAGSSSGTTMVTLPAGTPAGTWNILARCDAAEAVVETAENNNLIARSILIGPDLVVSTMTAPATGGAGQNITISETTLNRGGGSSGSSTTRLYLSTDALLDGEDLPLGSRSVPALAAGASSFASTLVSLPAGLAPGTYRLIAQADADQTVVETSESNNPTFRSIVVGADLVVTSVTAPGAAAPGQSITVGDTSKNQGGNASEASVTGFYLSINTTWEPTDVPLGSRLVPALTAGASSSGSTIVTLPSDAGIGTYYLIARCDDAGVVAETAENNNLYALVLRIGPDLTVTSLTGPASGGAGLPIILTDSTRNQGGAPAASSVTEYYLSRDGTLDGTDILLGSRVVPVLAAGSTSSGSVTVNLPSDTATGGWYVLAKADGAGAVTETVESNNLLVRSIQVGPDLTISSMSAPTSGVAGQAITVNETTRNAGGGPAGDSVTRFYLSSNSLFDAGDQLLAERGVSALPAGAVSSQATTVLIPAGTGAGSWYLLARCDDAGTITETAENNNVYARSVQITVAP